MNEKTTIAFLGTGRMGFPMAANLARAGFHLRVWNRTASRTDELARLGAVPAATPADAARGADIVITMLTDGATVANAMFRPLGGLDASHHGQVWVQMSTVGVEWTRDLEEDARSFGVTFVDAPVSGSEGPARAGDLVILASGPDGVRETLAPVFAALGKSAVWLGEAGAGSRAKLVLNNLLVNLVEATAETLRFAEGLDLDPAAIVDLIAQTPLGSPYTVQKARTMLAGDFRPAFALKHAVKDAVLAVDAAHGAATGLTLTEALLPAWRGAASSGHAEDDLSVVFEVKSALLPLQIVDIETSGGPAHGELTIPDGGASFLLTATHGAGGTPDTADVLAVRDAAGKLGAATALITQPYRVRGARAPGSAPKQDQAWTELTAELRRLTGGVPLVQCGRSNGARVVCRTALAVGASGALALAFPLHPPGQPGKSRAGELGAAGVPVLVVNGDRDPFGIPDENNETTRVVVLPGETHSLTKNPALIGDIVTAWLGALSGVGRS
ncbi:MAG: alpha/beta family hydrolase [Trebonia sp.]